MMKSFKVCAVASILFTAFAFAQESAPEPSAVEAVPALEPQAASESIPEPAAPEQPVAAEQAAQVQEPALEAQAAPEQELEAVSSETAAVQEEALSQEQTAQDSAVQDSSAAEHVAQEQAAPVQEEQQVEAPAATVQEQVLTPEPQKIVVHAEQAQAIIKDFHLGIRAGLGISAMRKHKAVEAEFEKDIWGLIKLDPAISASVGFVFAFEINDLLTIAPELNYTLYRASGQFVAVDNSVLIVGNKFSNRNLQTAEAELHSIELPILVRFNLGLAYVELGPQIGINLESRIYQNSDIKSPEQKYFAFGPSLGGGVNINGVLLGLRGYFGLLEYAKYTKGYPWAVHASVTKFFF